MSDHDEPFPIDGEDIVARINMAIDIIKLVKALYVEPAWIAKCNQAISDMEELIAMITL